MNPPSDNPNWVRCSCQHCAQEIVFDSTGFSEGETRGGNCPHCGLEIALCLPSQKLTIEDTFESLPILEASISAPPAISEADTALEPPETSEAHAIPEPPQPISEAPRNKTAQLREMYKLVRGYFFGEGLEQNLMEAYKWIYLADNPAFGGFGEAISIEEESEMSEIRNYLADNLTSDQIVEAHHLAALECEKAHGAEMLCLPPPPPGTLPKSDA